MKERTPSEIIALLQRWRYYCALFFALCLGLIIIIGDQGMHADWVPDEEFETAFMPKPQLKFTDLDMGADGNLNLHMMAAPEAKPLPTNPLAETPIWYERYTPPKPERPKPEFHLEHNQVLMTPDMSALLRSTAPPPPEPKVPLSDHLGKLAFALFGGFDLSFLALAGLLGVFGLRLTQKLHRAGLKLPRDRVDTDMPERLLVMAVAVSYFLAADFHAANYGLVEVVFLAVLIIVLPEFISAFSKRNDRAFPALQKRLIYVRSTVELPVVFLTLGGLIHRDWRLYDVTARLSDVLIASALILALIHLGLLAFNKVSSNGSRPGPI